MRKAQAGELVAIDLEMFGMTKPHRADGSFACMSIGFEDGDVYQITDENDIPNVLDDLDEGLWCFQNALFDLRLLRRFVPDLAQRPIHDTMLMDMDMWGGWYSRFSLANLARRYLGVLMDKEIRDEFSRVTEMTPEMVEYAKKDAIYTAQIARKQLQTAYELFDGIMPWYTDIDEPALWAVLDMVPARVDVEAWERHTKGLAEDIGELQEALGLNVYSHKNVKASIEALLGKSIRNTNAKETLEPLLAELEPDHPAAVLVREVIEIRKVRKAVETYGLSWIEQHVEDGGYVYPSYRVTGAETGRMACADPNLQNIPAREMPIYRTFFIPSEEHVLQVADVSQQEPWFSAHLSGDLVLTKELSEGIDLHQVTADLFSVDRRKGKDINLGLNYGMSEYGLAARVGISVDKAKAGITARDRRYRQLTAWRNERIREARRFNKVHTVTGRPVWVNPYNYGWERNAINAPVQGSAADHTKLALVKLHQICKDAEIPFRVSMVVHDEIVQDAPNELRVIYANLLRTSWEQAAHELAPGMGIKAEVIEGQTWGEAK